MLPIKATIERGDIYGPRVITASFRSEKLIDSDATILGPLFLTVSKFWVVSQNLHEKSILEDNIMVLSKICPHWCSWIVTMTRNYMLSETRSY